MPHLTITQLFPNSFLNDSSLKQSMGEDFNLCENGNMVFHWADFDETCDAIKNALTGNVQLTEEFKRREVALEKLSLITVWIRTDKKVHQTTMYDLYERYILNQMQLSLGIDPFGPIEVSFISSTGPFRSMAIAECFNDSTYRDFVMVYLLKGKLPKRDYRVRLKSKILLEHGHEFSNASLINLEQLTMNGMLLSLDSDFFIRNISNESQIRILMDTSVLKDGFGKNIQELRELLSPYAFNLMYSSRKEDSFILQMKDITIQSSFDFLKNRKVYMFVSFDHFSSEDKNRMKNIQNFVSHTRELIRNYYKDTFSTKTA